MTEPIIIDGKWYEPAGMARGGMILLKPLPKQPEAEKRCVYVVIIYTFDKPTATPDELFEHYLWTPHQAQLAADAVKAVLQYIQGDEPYSTAFKEAVVAARNAITKGES